MEREEAANALADMAEQLLEHWFITGSRALSRGNAMRLHAALANYREATGQPAMASGGVTEVKVLSEDPNMLVVKIGGGAT